MPGLRLVRGRRRPRAPSGDRGMVTAETALALPALVIVLAALITVVVAVSAQLRCVAAAREGARAAARGENAATVQRLATSQAPESARVQQSDGGETVTVTVTARVHPLGLRIAVISVQGSATAQREPDAESAARSGAAALLVLLSAAGHRRLFPVTGRRQRGTRRRARGERGSGTVYAGAAIGVVVALGAGVVLVSKAHVARSRAEAAADLAALAAAQALVDASGDPCARAAGIARSNAATLTACAVEGETVVVRTEVPVSLGGLGIVKASGTARAGPVADGAPVEPSG